MSRYGNIHKGGRKKASHTLESEALRTLYIDLAKEHGIPIARALIKKAMKGDTQAIREFNDRAFGRPSQAITHEGEIILKLDA